MNKKISFKLNKLYAVMVLLVAQNAFAAANFNIVPDGALPTSVNAGETVSAYFIVKNNTSSTRASYHIEGLPSTVTQNTTSPNCPALINLEGNASCRLQLDITGAVNNAKVAICYNNSCTTGNTPLNVTVNSTPPAPTARYIYMTTTDSTSTASVLVCPLGDDGSFALGACQNADVSGDLDSVFPEGIVINKAGTTAYLTSDGQHEKAYQCTINPSTKLFDSCTYTGNITGDYYYTQYGMLGLSTSDNEVFIANYADADELSLTRCPIVNNVIDSNCVSSAKLSNSSSSYGLGVAVNSTTVYASTYSDSNVAICPIADWGTACTIISGVRVEGTDTDLSNPSAVALNPDSSILYIGTESAPYVYGCNPTAISGGTLFSNCFVATQFSSGGVWSMIVNAKNTDAYYTGNFTGTLYHCKIHPDGTIPIGECETITGFANSSNPLGMALLY